MLSVSKIGWIISFASVNLVGVFLFTWPIFLDTRSFGFRELSQATWLAVVLALIAVLIISLQVNANLLDSKNGSNCGLLCCINFGAAPAWRRCDRDLSQCGS